MKAGTLCRLFPGCLLLLALVLAACRNNEPPPPPAVGEAALVVCDDACSARGQCGTLATSAQVVLANQGGPAVTLHDTYFLNQAAVTVEELFDRAVLPAENGEPVADQSQAFNHTFFRVRDAAGVTAWVAGWCVARP